MNERIMAICLKTIETINELTVDERDVFFRLYKHYEDSLGINHGANYMLNTNGLIAFKEAMKFSSFDMQKIEKAVFNFVALVRGHRSTMASHTYFASSVFEYRNYDKDIFNISELLFNKSENILNNLENDIWADDLTVLDNI